jgi:hypothetical protein
MVVTNGYCSKLIGAGVSLMLAQRAYSTDWRMSGGIQARRQLGIVTAFSVSESTVRQITICYQNVYLVAGFAVSASGLLLCLVLIMLVLRKRRDN